MSGEEFERSEPLYWHLPSGDAATVMRKDQWKIIQYHVKKEVELYDLEADPAETTNLAKSHPEKTTELIREMTEWRQNHKAPLPPAAHLKY